MGKILVTGASGNVGSFVVKYLLEAGQPVIAAGTHPQKKPAGGIAGEAEYRRLSIIMKRQKFFQKN